MITHVYIYINNDAGATPISAQTPQAQMSLEEFVIKVLNESWVKNHRIQKCLRAGFAAKLAVGRGSFPARDEIPGLGRMCRIGKNIIEKLMGQLVKYELEKFGSL